MTHKSVSRRSILAGVAIAVLAGAEAVHVHTAYTQRKTRMRQLIAHFSGAYALGPIGRVYIDTFAHPNDLPATMAELERRLGGALTSRDLTSAIQAVEAAIDHDFDDGDLVEVRGWLLPRTTALLALASIQIGQTNQPAAMLNI